MMIVVKQMRDAIRWLICAVVVGIIIVLCQAASTDRKVTKLLKEADRLDRVIAKWQDENQATLHPHAQIPQK